MYQQYADRAMEWRGLQDLVDAGQLDHQSKIEFTRVCESAGRALERANRASQEYQEVIEQYNATQASWMQDVTQAAQDFEVAERARIAFLVAQAMAYCDTVDVCAQECLHSTVGLRAVYRDVSAEADVVAFCREQGTGSERPSPLAFIKMADVLQASVAQGPSPRRSTIMKLIK